MKIGVVIPCYGPHAYLIPRILSSIERQTVKPYKVSISCSSQKDNIILEDKYSFPVIITTSEEIKNPAQNRNIAIPYLNDCDYVTFMDVDDIMHCQRLEFLEEVMKTGADIILHNYNYGDIPDEETKYDKIVYTDQTLKISPSGCVTHKFMNDSVWKIHHSQVTVKREVLERVKFREDDSIRAKRNEDCVFCVEVMSLPNIKSVYIPLSLSYYIASGT